MYAIKVKKTNRYIAYCDECWYETDKEPLYIYSYDEAKSITKQLNEHYIYSVDIIDKNGNIESINAFNSPIKEIKEIKKSISKLRIRL